MITIAVVSVVGGDALDRVVNGIKNALNRKLKESFQIYQTSGPPDPAALRIRVHSCLRKKVDLIIATGARATHTALEETAKERFPIPIVFWGISEPAKHGIIHSIESSRNNATGVFMEPFNPVLPI